MFAYNKNLLVLATLLASSSALEINESLDDDRVGIHADFAHDANRTMEGHLMTSDEFRIEIESVAINSDQIGVRATDEDAFSRLMDEIVAPELVGRYDYADATTELQLSDVRFIGRVYDESNAGRLPSEGLGIAGDMPIAMIVDRDVEGDFDVSFELPTHYFDGITWG